jgi:DNA modification methylase
MSNKILIGDALTVLRQLDDKSVNMVFTSPPYFKQRDYKADGQLGWEDTPQDFVNRLCDVFDEVKRVLRDDGSCFVNLGDKYLDKSLCLTPQMFPIEMTYGRGWLCRNDIIWEKLNCVPFSGDDRFTCNHEVIWFFTKNADYYFDQQIEARTTGYMHEAWQQARSQDQRNKKNLKPSSVRAKSGGHKAFLDIVTRAKEGRGLRTVWHASVGHGDTDHPAPFPKEIVRPAILSCCPPGGTVLDPFFGSGTTGEVALEEGREFVGIEINKQSAYDAWIRLKSA